MFIQVAVFLLIHFLLDYLQLERLSLIERGGPIFTTVMLTARDSLCSDTSVKCNVLTIDDPSETAVLFSTTPDAPVCISVYDTSMCILAVHEAMLISLFECQQILLPTDRLAATQLVGVISSMSDGKILITHI